MKKASLFATALLSASLFPCALGASSGELPGVTLKPARVALFKNGFGYISLEGKMPGAKKMELKNLPVPSFGTFWLSTPPSAEILKLSSDSVKTREKVGDGDFFDLAASNIGAEVTIGMKNQGGDREVRLSGLIESVSSAPEPSRPNMIGQTRTSPSHGEKLVYIREKFKEHQGEEAQESVIVIPAREIASMRFASKTPATPEREVETRRISLELKEPSGETLTANCLAKGIVWVPEYRMDLSDPGQAVFSAQATVINELMDMEHVEMKFVSGYPSLKFSGVSSPITGDYDNVWKFLNKIYPAENGGVARAVPYNMAITSNGMQSDRFARNLSSFGEAPAVEQVEDLFFYPVKNFSCKYGETVMVPLFGGKVPYKHVYIWNIPEQTQITQWNSQTVNGQLVEDDTSCDIWHCIRFTNTFSLPLTRGALEFTSKGSLAGQGMVNFISPGQEATVTLNKTLQVSVKRAEKILSSVRKTDTNRTYTEFLVEGTLTMRNYSDKPVSMEVNKKVLGTPVSASDGGTFVSIPGWSNNPNAQFKWSVDVAPGETKTLTYQYQYQN